MTDGDRPAVTIVGAGLAGLVIARDLAIADVRVTLLEAADRPGGQLASAVVAGIEVDLGAESFTVAGTGGGGAAQQLVTELGLELVRPLESSTWVVHGADEARPLPAEQLLGIPAVPLAREVIDLIGPWAALRAQFDALAPMVRSAKYRTIEQLVRRRMGRRVFDRIVAPVLRARYGSSDVAIDDVARQLAGALAFSGTLSAAVGQIVRQRPPVRSQVAIDGGMHRLVTTLAARAARVGVDIRTNARVASVDAASVLLEDGERLTGEVVIETPDLGSPRREREETVVVAAVDSAALDAPPRGDTAVVAAGATGIAARAYAHSSAIWPCLGADLPPHRHLVRLVYDEAPRDPATAVAADLRAIAGVGDAVVVDLAMRTWRRPFGHSSPVDGVRAVGGAAAAADIAAVVEHARETAADLIRRNDGSA